jgi:hypothetical protein
MEEKMLMEWEMFCKFATDKNKLENEDRAFGLYHILRGQSG